MLKFQEYQEFQDNWEPCTLITIHFYGHYSCDYGISYTTQRRRFVVKIGGWD